MIIPYITYASLSPTVLHALLILGIGDLVTTEGPAGQPLGLMKLLGGREAKPKGWLWIHTW